LGPRLIRLGETASRLVGSWARPYLAGLVDAIGETANMATLDGDEVVYVAQAPSRHSMRMFTEVGRRVLPHCTAVGKALLAQLPPAEVGAILARSGLPAQTPHTVTDAAELHAQLKAVRTHGYATDEGEQELGVRCVAVPVASAPTPLAISVSGPEGRLSENARERIVPVLTRTAELLTLALASQGGSGASGGAGVDPR
ncbi:MAG: IclR family transcriptional regulator, partial [Streptomycetales bacterium]